MKEIDSDMLVQIVKQAETAGYHRAKSEIEAYRKALIHIGSEDAFDCCLEAIENGNIFEHFKSISDEALNRSYDLESR